MKKASTKSLKKYRFSFLNKSVKVIYSTIYKGKNIQEARRVAKSIVKDFKGNGIVKIRVKAI